MPPCDCKATGTSFCKKAYRGAKAFFLKQKDGADGPPEIYQQSLHSLPSADQAAPHSRFEDFFPIKDPGDSGLHACGCMGWRGRLVQCPRSRPRHSTHLAPERVLRRDQSCSLKVTSRGACLTACLGLMQPGSGSPSIVEMKQRPRSVQGRLEFNKPLSV